MAEDKKAKVRTLKAKKQYQILLFRSQTEEGSLKSYRNFHSDSTKHFFLI